MGPDDAVETDERVFPADAAALRDIRSYIRACAQSDKVSGPVADDIVLAVSEASTNAIVHTATGQIRVHWEKQADTVIVRISDDGVFREATRMPSLDGPGGRGLLLMHALMDDVRMRRGTEGRPGTVVRMAKRTG